MLPGTAHRLRHGMYPHRSCIEKRSAEHVWVVALQPVARLSDWREGGGTALRRAVRAEAVQLLEGALGELGRVAMIDRFKRRPPGDAFLSFSTQSIQSSHGLGGPADVELRRVTPATLHRAAAV